VITLVALHTNLPVPRVLAWSDSTSGPVGAEYIIMEHVPGVSLLQTWYKMSGVQHIRFIHAMALNMRKLNDLSFPAYGSLYFSHSPFLKAVSKYDVGNNICIGPHCGTDYWDCSNDESKDYHWREPNRGPCKHNILPVGEHFSSECWTKTETLQGLISPAILRVSSMQDILEYPNSNSTRLHLSAYHTKAMSRSIWTC